MCYLIPNLGANSRKSVVLHSKSRIFYVEIFRRRWSYATLRVDVLENKFIIFVGSTNLQYKTFSDKTLSMMPLSLVLGIALHPHNSLKGVSRIVLWRNTRKLIMRICGLTEVLSLSTLSVLVGISIQFISSSMRNMKYGVQQKDWEMV